MATGEQSSSSFGKENNMEKKYLIGVDLGTTTVQVVFLNAQENKVVLTLTEEIFPVSAENPDYIEYDPNDWWEYTKRLLKRGFESGVKPEEVAGICFDGWTVMAFLVKKDGTPVTNAIHYNDMRHMDLLEKADKLFGNEAVERNGNYIGMYSGSVKQYWWKEKHPEVFAQADYLSTEVSWMNYRLTGQWAWNRSEAGFYSQYNHKTREWDDDIISRMGFPRSMFPRLVDAWELVGTVTKEAAEQTGLCEGTPVFGGTDDTSPVAIATGAIGLGQSYISSGSGGNIAANTAGPVSHPTAITYPHCIPGLSITITVMTSMGLSYKWMRNTFGDLETEQGEKTGIDPYEYMNRKAQTSRPGSGGVVCLPYLDGDYTPNNDCNARGVFIGMSTGTTKGDMFRAVLEGVAFSVLDNLMLFGQFGAKISEIVLTGGLAKSALWLQIISDVTGCPISLPEETEGAAFGSALIAGVGAGLFADFEEAVERMVKIRRHAFVPHTENHEIYRELFSVYKSLYPKLKDTFSQLADIRNKLQKSEPEREEVNTCVNK